MSRHHIADTGLFVATGDPSNKRYEAVRRFARRTDVTFVLPEQVYEELTTDESSSRTPPIDAAIDEEWATVAGSLEFSQPLVSRVMDGVQRYIANADDRPADQVERADAALAALTAQYLSTKATTEVYIYTTDIAAGEGAETVLASEGYGDSVTFVNGFRFIEDCLSTDDYWFSDRPCGSKTRFQSDSVSDRSLVQHKASTWIQLLHKVTRYDYPEGITGPIHSFA